MNPRPFVKPCCGKMFFLPALLAGLGLLLAGRVHAQTFTTLHSFTALSVPYSGTNSDGAAPNAGLILSGNALYGTTDAGGSLGQGAVFKINTDGTGFTNLHTFFGYPSDGTAPDADLVLSGNTLFGTTSSGGDPGRGTVFKVNTDGSGFTNLHNFDYSDGFNPFAGLVLSDNTLYGTAAFGGSSGSGTVFRLNTDGSGFTNLHSFTSYNGFYSTNSDGFNPFAGLVLSDNTLYGAALSGGISGNGTIFRVNTDGSCFTNLHNFTSYGGHPYTNSDGANPYGRLVLSSNTLYGTTFWGGSSGAGVAFGINTDGTGFTNLHSFSGLNDYPTNSDGFNPFAGLILSDDTLYGTAPAGGSSGNGTLFAIDRDGTGFTTLHNFAPPYISSVGTNIGGARPVGGLILSGKSFYGTAFSGGSSGSGTVFSISFAPQLTIVPSGADVVLSWPSKVAGFDYAGFILQSAPASTGTFTNIPGATSPYTNAITGSQKYFRLVSN